MITINGMASPGNGVTGCQLTPIGGMSVTVDTQPVFRGYSLNSGSPTSQINADGSAVFDGNIEADNVTRFANKLRAAVAIASTLADLKAGLMEAIDEL